MIPFCLANSDDFQGLTGEARDDFEARLICCAEILEKLQSLPDPADEAFLAELDDMELDVYSVMSLGNSISPWQVHTWTFDCVRKRMLQALPADFERFIACPVPGLWSSPSQDRDWLHDFGNGLNNLFHAFAHAEVFDGAVANCIAIDIMMAMLLQYCGSKRLGWGENGK
jgi:hypothetical protein